MVRTDTFFAHEGIFNWSEQVLYFAHEGIGQNRYFFAHEGIFNQSNILFFAHEGIFHWSEQIPFFLHMKEHESRSKGTKL